MPQYMLGRLPEDQSRPRLRLTAHLRAGAAPPPAVDWYSHVPAWGMEGNDQWGCCVFAGNAHLVEQQTALGEDMEVAVTTAQTLAEYSRVTGFDPGAGPSGANPTDRGALVQDGLADLRRNGLAGQKIAAFARCDHTSTAEIQTALAEFGCADFGVQLPRSAMDQFDAGEPWDVVADDGGILGGHCILAVGYDARYVYVVTWGRVVPVTYAWLRAYLEEAWAVISADWAGEGGKTPTGVDLRSLGEEFAALTGESNPFPAVTPPAPGPAPHGVLAELAAELRALIARAEALLRKLGL